MAILERITRNIDNCIWNPGVEAFPVKNKYTAGVAGQKFFEELKSNGKICGTTCEKCQTTYVPGRIYCEQCFSRLEKWVDVGTEGILFSYTKVYKNKDGSGKENPTLMAAVKIADGLIMHRLGETNLDKLAIGIKVKAVLKEKTDRTGSINDISHFAIV